MGKYIMGFNLQLKAKAVASIVIIASLLVGGCANTGSSMLPGSSGADPRLTQGNDAQFFSKSGYQACAMGAGVGILSCALSNSSNKAVCAVVAGLASCGVAMGANYYLDNRRSQYADTTQRLQVMSDDVKADTAKVVARTATAQQVISDDQARIAQLKKDIASKKVDAAKAKTEVAEVDENIALLRKDLGNMRNKITEYTKVADLERTQNKGANLKDVDQNILKMNEKVASLQKEVDGLYNQRSAITLG
jgi:hypothetical protein